jgi:phage shock protein PspC (stress-responsive transcriptional regulator)
MDKINKIHIVRVPYSIEPKAEAALQRYLHDIRANLDIDTADEVIQDIESRIPELLAVRHIHQNGVITHDDVLAIQKQLGEPEQFASGEGPSKSGDHPKKLFRDTDAAILGGVASGIGKYLNVDANLVRVAFFVAVFLSGFGIILYLFLWLLLPEAKTGADKLLMSGEPVTVATLQHYRESVQKSLGKGPRLLQRLLLKAVRVFAIAFTALISLVLLSAFGTISGLFYMYPFRPIVNGYGVDYILLGLLWLGCIAFIGLLIMLTIRVCGYKSSRLSLSALALSVLFIITLAGTTTSALLVYNHFSNTYGNGKGIRALTLTNESPNTMPATLAVHSDNNLDLTYIVTNQPLHATYEFFPGMNHPNLTITNSKGVISVDSTQLDKTAPSCLGNLCQKVYLPLHVDLYGPDLKHVDNSNGATLTINNTNLGSSIDLTANDWSTININNSYATQMSIAASNNSIVSANNTTAQKANITIDTTSSVSSPITNTLTASLPASCYGGGDETPETMLSLANAPQRTVINGQVQTMFALNQNDCVSNNQ